jgi:microsomal dipeptidase-like Zn-dependent dipeptidase
LINEYATLTKFTQSDFKTLSEGNVRVICASLSPLEKGFFVSRLGTGPFTDLVAQVATGIGFRKINFLQKNKNYFTELENEMDFYKQLHGKKIRIKGVKKEYRIVKNYSEIMQNLSESKNIISVIITIEGGHVFNEDNTCKPPQSMVDTNIDKVGAWTYKPLFMSMTHHFYNYMCGHASSLPKILKGLLNQKDHVNTDFTDLGKAAVRRILDKDILIDVKHMSRKSRHTFYSIMEEDAYKDMPIIISHGSVNGYPTVYTDDSLNKENGLFYGTDINFYDDELVKIARSKGLFGLQLDERRIASSDELAKIKHSLPDKVRKEMYAELVWNQMLHIANTLDQAGEDAWDCICIGSDYDGIVNPMDGFWTSSDFKELYNYVLLHVRKYLITHPNSFAKPSNNISAEEIMDKMSSGNVLRFLSENYTS